MKKNVGKMELSTPSDREIMMTRVFAAPRRMVFDAYTKPELLKQWLGIHNDWKFAVCDVDLRVGGKYRWIWRNASGQELAMGGEYREIVVPERVVATEHFDDPWYEGEALSTVTFEERAGQTTLAMANRYASKEIRDAVLKSPMETGVAKGFDTLEQLLAGDGLGAQRGRGSSAR
jgi:uncharacterized protein YndB with AHSA1/START domain